MSLPLQEGPTQHSGLINLADASQRLFLPVLALHGVSGAHWLSIAITTYGKRGNPGEAVVGPGGEEEVEQIAEKHRVPGRLVWRQVTTRKVEKAGVHDADEVKEQGRSRWGNMKRKRNILEKHYREGYGHRKQRDTSAAEKKNVNLICCEHSKFIPFLAHFYFY